MVTTNRARAVWTEQCKAARSIRSRYGLKAASDYLVTEKVVNFADAAASQPDFAKELPAFVAKVRSIFAPHELAQHFAAIEQAQATEAAAAPDPDDAFGDEPTALLAARAARFATIKQVLVAGRLARRECRS